MFNDTDEQKSQFLVQVRNWDKADCIDFLSHVRDRYNLAPNINLSTEEVMVNMDLQKLKGLVVTLVQSCTDLDQIRSYSLKGWY